MTTCEARLGWRLVETENGYPSTLPEVCGQAVGVRAYIADSDSSTHRACTLPGHAEDVRRRFPPRYTYDSRTHERFETTPSGRVVLAPDVARSLLEEFQHHGGLSGWSENERRAAWGDR